MNIAALLAQPSVLADVTGKSTKENTSLLFSKIMKAMPMIDETYSIREQLSTNTDPITTVAESFADLTEDAVLQVKSLLEDTGDIRDWTDSVTLDQVSTDQLIGVLEQLVISNENSHLSLEDEDIKMVTVLIDKLTKEVEDSKDDPTLIEFVIPPMNYEVKPYVKVVDVDQAKHDFEQLTEKVEQLLTVIVSDEDVDKQTKDLLNLLKEWSSLAEIVPDQAKLWLANQSDADAEIWSHVTTNYQKRMDLDSKTSYQTSTTVTTADVSKWITAAISKMDAGEVLKQLELDTDQQTEWNKALATLFTGESDDDAGLQIQTLFEGTEDLSELNKSEKLLALLQQLAKTNAASDSKQSDSLNRTSTDFEQLIDKMEQYLTTLSTSEEADQQENIVLKMLEQWINSGQVVVVPEQANNVLVDQQVNNNVDLWSRMLSNNRDKISADGKAGDSKSTKVTHAEASKWLTAAMNRMDTGTEQQAQSFADTFVNGQAVSQLEQFTVHVGEQGMNKQEVADQLIEKFQQAMDKSTFMTTSKGSNQLLLRLSPESLGDVTVQLTQVDGEMLVKITATTQAAKEALESNVRQLRHMFSPQQVVIEKQELQQVAVEKQAFQQNDDQMSESADQNNQNSENDSGTREEEAGLSFEEVLINERV